MALVAAASFLDALRHTQLLPPAQLEELVREAPRFAEARALAHHLLERGWLTPYQVNQLILERGPDLVLGQYVLLERLGEGVRGQIFKARHRHMKRTVALKVIRKELLADADAVQRFYLEIQAASQLDHPNVVHAYDAGPIGPAHFLAMEYVRGADLARLVQQAGPLSVPRACAYVAQAALGLQHAAERGLVHRDIKPGNLLLAQTRGLPPVGVEPQGDSSVEEISPADAAGLYEWGQVKVLDFGLARLRRFVDDPNHPLTHEGAMVGTPDFMAPEQATDAHAVDVRADLYSLGCTFYFLLTGRPPFPGGSYIQKVDGHRWQEPDALDELRPELSPELTAVVQKLMAKRPEDRYQLPAEVAVALANLMGVPIGAPPVPHSVSRRKSSPDESATLPIRPVFRKGSRRWLLSGAAVLAACLAALLFWAIRPPSNPATQPEAGAPAGDLKRLVLRAKSGSADPAETWLGFVDLGQRYPHAPEAIQASKWLLRIPSPLDRIDPKHLHSTDRLPGFQPKELVAVLGENRWRHWQSPVHAIACRPDGQVMATGCNSSSIHLWEASTGRLLALLPCQQGPIRVLAYSPNGKFLASASHANHTIRLWDAGDNKLLAELPGHKRPVCALAFSPDSQVLASGSADNTARLWDLANRKERAVLGDHKGLVAAVAFAPDGRTLATGSQDGTIRLWNVADPRQPRAAWNGHLQVVSTLAFASRGNVLASGAGGEGMFVKLWDLATNREKWRKKYGRPVWTVTFAPDGQTVVAAGAAGTIHRWNVASGQEQGKPIALAMEVRALAFAPNGKQLAAVGTRPFVRLFDFPAGTVASPTAGHKGLVSAVAFSPDARTLLSGSHDRTVEQWDPVTGKEKAVISTDLWPVTGVACSPDGRTVAVICRNDALVRLYDPAGKPKGLLMGHKGGIFAAAFAPDGRTLVTAGVDQTLRLWELPSSRELRKRPAAKDAGCVAFSPDGKLLAFAGPDRTIRIYDWAADREQAICKGHTDLLQATAFAPDGRTLASGSADKTIRLWDVHSGRQRAKVGEHAAAVTALVFTADGSTLISAGLDGVIAFWKPAVSARLREWTFPGPIHALALAADGRHLATGNGNGTAYILRLAPAPAPP